MSTFSKVLEFHHKFKAPVGDERHPTLDFERVQLRFDLIAEEFCELVAALYGEQAAEFVGEAISDEVAYANDPKFTYSHPARDGDLVAAADALADLEYVVNGFAVEAGIPHDLVVDEVHKSNMSKLGEDGEPILREDGKILKGPNFQEPNLPWVLGLVPANGGAL